MDLELVERELSVAEVATRLGVSRRTVRRYLLSGELHGTRPRRGWWLKLVGAS